MNTTIWYLEAWIQKQKWHKKVKNFFREIKVLIIMFIVWSKWLGKLIPFDRFVEKTECIASSTLLYSKKIYEGIAWRQQSYSQHNSLEI